MYLPFERPWMLGLIPLAMLPWLRRARSAQGHPWLGLLPPDRMAEALGVALRALASLAIALCALAMAGPFRITASTEHVGRGAQIVFVVDRSLSMDQAFGARPVSGRTGVDALSGGESKGAAARRLLAEFARHRTHDLMAMLAFTTNPIRIAGFTDRQAVIQAAIAAGGVGHGIADTNIGSALIAALGMFRDQPYNGSRVLLLVSDGGARLDVAVQARIADLMKREHVALYWLYLRTTHSPGLEADGEVSEADQDLVPEHFLHRYFLAMGSPYRAYEAENPGALEQAMADVDRLQSQPMRYRYPGVRRDLTSLTYALALGLAVMMTWANWREVRA